MISRETSRQEGKREGWIGAGDGRREARARGTKSVNWGWKEGGPGERYEVRGSCRGNNAHLYRHCK